MERPAQPGSRRRGQLRVVEGRLASRGARVGGQLRWGSLQLNWMAAGGEQDGRMERSLYNIARVILQD